MTKIKLAAAATLLAALVRAKIPDRSRLAKHRQANGKISDYHDNGRPLEGHAYRSSRGDLESQVLEQYQKKKLKKNKKAVAKPAPWQLPTSVNHDSQLDDRELSSQLSGCCYNYQKYSASKLCYIYGHDCSSGNTPSHDSGDADCEQKGLSFIGISFSVNTANGNPYSYQLCDQFPMENIIDRDYEYIMSMDEDGWLVGGGYKQFDYSGKMP